LAADEMRTYRTAGNLIRSAIAGDADAVRTTRRSGAVCVAHAALVQGVESYHDPTGIDARRETHGLQHLPGLCP
jgi:hypothetical protein